MYAKLNLALEITGAEGGYHTLDMINCTVGAGDALAVSFAVIKKKKRIKSKI